MGYTIKIGNAKPVAGEDDFYWSVEGVKRDDAPAFGEPTDYTNSRWPSYTVWTDFCKAVGLYDLFLNKEADEWPLMGYHPGIARIKPTHLEQVQEAIAARKAKTGDKPAGFWDYDEETNKEIDNGKDPELVRLLWLEYWMRWTLENCEHPAIENS